MKSLKDFLIEASIEDIVKYIQDNNIDPDFALKAIEYRSAKKTYYSDENLKRYFCQRFDFSKNEKLFQNIIKEFIKKNCINLWEIAANEPKDKTNGLYGFIGINDLKNTPAGNLIKDFCKGWENTAHVLKNFVDSGSTAKGKFEVLLKFLLSEAVLGGKKGDISLYEGKELEVKTEEAHACGQKNVKTTGEMYEYMKQGFLSIENTKNDDYKKLCDQIRTVKPNDLRFFQNYDRMRNKNDKYVNGHCLLGFLEIIGPEEMSKLIVNAISFQNGEKPPYFGKGENEILYKQTEKYLKDIKNNEDGFKTLLDVVGAIQLYFYAITEKFDYFICLDQNSSEGRYVFIENENKSGEKFLEFDFILKYFTFGILDMTTSSNGRTGKIYFRRK